MTQQGPSSLAPLHPSLLFNPGPMINPTNLPFEHYIHRSNWLRAAVLGANDGIISIASLAVGIASAGTERSDVLLATVAGLVAGALSMAAGEYVSVSAQTDIEQADIEREKVELATMPDQELALLADIYRKRGLSPATAMQVAVELTEKDALGAHVRDELGINDVSQAKPLLASVASGAAFCAGGFLPLLVGMLCPMPYMSLGLYLTTMVALLVLGYASARVGGSSPIKAMGRIVIWGSLAMGASALVGQLFGVTL